jgi:hypothetical protein
MEIKIMLQYTKEELSEFRRMAEDVRRVADRIEKANFVACVYATYDDDPDSDAEIGCVLKRGYICGKCFCNLLDSFQSRLCESYGCTENEEASCH